MKLVFYKDGALGDIAVLVPLFLLLRERFAPLSLTLVSKEGFFSPLLVKWGILDSRIPSGSGDVYKVFSRSGRSELLESLAADRLFFLTDRVPDSCRTLKTSVIPSLPKGRGKEFVAFYYIREVFTVLGVELPVLHWDSLAGRMRESAILYQGRESQARRRILFHPGSGSGKKNLKPSRFLNLLDSFSQGDFRKTLLLGPVEMEQLDADTLASYRERVDETIIEPDIETLIALLRETKFYFGMDSGVTHLANFFAEKVIVFFGTSDPLLWSPESPGIKRVLLADSNFQQ